MIANVNLREIVDNYKRGIAAFPDESYRPLISMVGENLFYLMPLTVTKKVDFVSVYFHAEKSFIVLLDNENTEKPLMSFRLKKHDILEITYYHSPLIWYRFKIGVASGVVSIFRVVRDTRKSEPATSFIENIGVSDLRDYDALTFE